jgi:hypothetical protein
LGDGGEGSEEEESCCEAAHCYVAYYSRQVWVSMRRRLD